MLGERVDAVRDADEAYLQEFEQALNREQVCRGAREPGQVFDHNHIDLTWLVHDQTHHPFIARSIGAGAARGAIGKRQVVTDSATVGNYEFVATPELIIDARFALPFG